MDKTNKHSVLITSIRPSKLDDLIGSKKIVDTLKKQFDEDKVPHFYLICGNSGSGKTTLARIIAMMLQKAEGGDITRYDIKEINASDKNGIDDVREIISNSNYVPLKPSVAKIIIMDEAHQLTTAAQNALLKITEDPPKAFYIIFCTTNESKIIKALQRRAYVLYTQGLGSGEINKLLQIAKTKIKSNLNIAPLEEILVKYDIDSPGLVLQAAEQYFNGCDPLECLFLGSNSELDTKKLCNLLSKGDWKSSVPILKEMKKEDVVMVKNCVLGYFKTILLTGTVDKKTLAIANAINVINGPNEYFDLTLLLANLRIACDIISTN
jgi:DNA polymerase III delta prime subunit